MRGEAVVPDSEGKFSIRKFRDRDLPSVHSIEQEIFAPPWPRSVFLYIAKSSWGTRGEILLLEHDVPGAKPTLVGYACMTWEKGIGHLLNLAIAKTFRGRNLGQRLLLAAINRFIEKKLSAVVLEVRITNRVAIGLYEKHGFVIHHVEKAYYPDGEDGLVMVKPLKTQ